MKFAGYTATIIALSLFLLGNPRMVAAQSTKNTSSLAQAQILTITDNGKKNPQNHQPIQEVKLRILTGNYKDEEFTVEDNAIALPYQIHFSPGGRVIVTVSDDGKGQPQVYITDYDRRLVLYILGGLFIVLTLFVTRKQGLMSLLGMIISLYIIARITIPQILAGTDAFTITIISALIIIPITYYLAHGFNKKSTVAVIGTTITLIMVAVLSYFFSHAANLTGYASEEAVYLQNLYGPSINVFNLLIAGIIIGGLAVLNDITISQASIVSSLRKTNRNLSFKQLYERAMEVGRDHVASLVNTLILVYVGAALPLVLLFNQTHTDFSLILNQEIIATEIIRTLVTSIGIVAAVPITTLIACLMSDN